MKLISYYRLVTKSRCNSIVASAPFVLAINSNFTEDAAHTLKMSWNINWPVKLPSQVSKCTIDPFTRGEKVVIPINAERVIVKSLHKSPYSVFIQVLPPLSDNNQHLVGTIGLSGLSALCGALGGKILLVKHVTSLLHKFAHGGIVLALLAIGVGIGVAAAVGVVGAYTTAAVCSAGGGRAGAKVGGLDLCQ